MNRDIDLKNISWLQAHRRAGQRSRAGTSRKRSKDLSLDWGGVPGSDLEEGSLDPKTIRLIVELSLWGVALLLMVVHFQVRAINLIYRSREMNKTLAELVETNKELLADISRLESPERLDPKAKALGLVDIRSQDVFYVRMPIRFHEESLVSPETHEEIDLSLERTLRRIATNIASFPYREESSG